MSRAGFHWVWLFTVFAPMTSCLQSSLAGESKRRLPQKLAALADAYISLDRLYVRYDLLVQANRSPAVKALTIVEAFSDGKYYNRIVHWYDQSLYQVSSEEMDPLLNSYYWSLDRRVRVHEARREYHVSKGALTETFQLQVKRYLGAIGKLMPEREMFFRANELTAGPLYDARYFYFPHGLAFGTWESEALDDSRTRFTRSVANRREILVVQDEPWLFLRERSITNLSSGASVKISFEEHEPVEHRFALPTRITVKQAKQAMLSLNVTKLATNFPEKLLGPEFAPGARVFGQDGRLVGAVPGGQQFLNSTIEKMKRASGGSQVSYRPALPWLYLILLWICGFSGMRLFNIRTGTQ